MIVQIYENYYILADKNSFIAAVKNDQESQNRRSLGFGLTLSSTAIKSEKDLEEEFDEKDTRFSHIGYYPKFLQALSCISNEIIRHSKKTNLKELSEELKEVKAIMSNFLSKEDLFNVIEIASNIKNPSPFTLANVQKHGKINKKEPYQPEQVKFFENYHKKKAAK